MITFNETGISRPSHLEIDTSWDPQEILWRTFDETERHDMIRRHVATSSLSHLVREVRIEDPGAFRDAPSLDQAHETIAKAEQEFELLESHGLAVANHQWHVFRDGNRTTALARVAIIDRVRPTSDGTYDTHKQTNSKVVNYIFSRAPGHRLQEIGKPDQHVFGVSRSSEDAADPQGYLVDLEPVFYVPLRGE